VTAGPLSRLEGLGPIGSVVRFGRLRCVHAVATGNEHTQRIVEIFAFEIAIERIGKQNDFPRRRVLLCRGVAPIRAVSIRVLSPFRQTATGRETRNRLRRFAQKRAAVSHIENVVPA